MNRSRDLCRLLLACLLLASGGVAFADVSTASLIKQIKAVGKEGKGNDQAAQAWKQLAQRRPGDLLTILTSLDGAEPIAANWLRSAVDAIVDNAVRAKQPLPVAELEKFVNETSHSGAIRRLAYECLVRADSTAPDRLLPKMLADPSNELRRDAVARVVLEARAAFKKGDKAFATAAFLQAFNSCLDRDQADDCVKELKQLGVAVNLSEHFGFIQQWLLLGPFDNHDGIGFDRAFPPEKAVDLKQSFMGKDGKPIHWTKHVSQEANGLVDLNKAIGKHMGATGYALAIVDGERERPIQIRVQSNNAVKIFLNGQMLLGNEEYHHGTRMDQYIGAGRFKPGRNEILLKICQNEQTEVWAQAWNFHMRVSDPVGAAIPVALTFPDLKP